MSRTKSELEVAANNVVSTIRQLRTHHPAPWLVALDGRSGTGKSSLATLIANRVDDVVVVSDDFYSGGHDTRWEGQTAKDKVDEAIDWKRLRTGVLESLLAGKPASWHPLNFEPGVGWVGWKEETVSLQPADVVIVDGVYSARPELADLMDLTVLVQAPDEIRRKRLRTRKGEECMKKWHSLWDSAEDYYFTQLRPKDSFDLVIQLAQR